MYIIIITLLIFVIVILGILCVKLNKKLEEHISLEEKNYLNYNVCREWLVNYILDRNIVSYFNKMGYREVAIYGLGEIGTIFLDSLRKTNLSVSYAIDKNASVIFEDISVITPDSKEYKEVDVIIVTPIFDFDKIKSILEKKVKCPIVSLEEVILEA